MLWAAGETDRGRPVQPQRSCPLPLHQHKPFSGPDLLEEKPPPQVHMREIPQSLKENAAGRSQSLPVSQREEKLFVLRAACPTLVIWGTRKEVYCLTFNGRVFYLLGFFRGESLISVHRHSILLHEAKALGCSSPQCPFGRDVRGKIV
ncbi:hypothetical protein JRQ81_009179 [Phrynocephalus forsythii]|uniref:Uncharacterized protein n=1 Tax=Phrynocephalus forsythii TaxID=171643 RepID=A0A9Q1AS19_9SAUR|nr:hypothetical protein JRQ81_009179 [Phrynocephalus forsythii]